MTEPKPHPAAELFEMMSDAELAPIIESMRNRGFDPGQPILRYEGLILDGRNRLRAAAIAGVEPVFEEVTETRDPYQLSWQRNAERRHLAPMQKAAIRVKMENASVAWCAERNRRHSAANEARAEKVSRQPRNGGVFAEKTVRSSPEDRTVKPDNRAVTALAERAGVSRATVERALKMQAEDPVKFDAVSRGEKPKRKASAPSARTVDHDARNAQVLELHNEGLGTHEIARRLGLEKSLVSSAKATMGVGSNSAPIKVWSDIDHVAVVLEGATPQIESLTALLEGPFALNADEQELRRCIKSLARSSTAISRLRAALKQRLP